jgi:hypothetical protein
LNQTKLLIFQPFLKFLKNYHKYPYRIEITLQTGDLRLLRPAIEGKNRDINVDIKIKEFDEIFASIDYGFKSINGCSIKYNIWQLGKILT